MKPIVIALTAFSFLAAPAAMAQPYPSHHGKPSYSQMHKGGPKYDARKYDNRRHQSWKKGNRLPPNYRGHVVKIIRATGCASRRGAITGSRSTMITC